MPGIITFKKRTIGRNGFPKIKSITSGKARKPIKTELMTHVTT